MACDVVKCGRREKQAMTDRTPGRRRAEPARATAVQAGERGIEQTFGRAVAVLDALAQASTGGLRFTDLMLATGFSKATLHRLLGGLVAFGFVDLEQPGGRYFPGYRLGAWAGAAGNRHGFAERAAPIVAALSERVRDTAYLSLRVGEMAVCLVLREGTAAIRALPLSPGDHSALGVGSASVAILAAIDDPQEVERVLAAPAHAAYRRRRGVSLEHVRRHLARTRQLGYSLVDDLNPDMTGMGMAVRDDAGRPMAAVSVATIHSRLQDSARREEVRAALGDAVARLQALLRQAPVAHRSQPAN